MIRKTACFKPLAAAALLAISGASQATITAYTTLAAFNAATVVRATDSFIDIAVGTGLSGPVSRSAGAYTYSVGATPAGTLYGAGSAANPALSSDTATDSISFYGFTGGVSAAGGNFFTSDIGGLFTPGSVTVTATDASGTVTQTIAGAQVSTFLGFTSTTGITSLTVTAVQTGLGMIWPTVDNLVLAQAVPEPGTYAMLLAGLGVLGASARRRRIACA